ncbi:MAG: alanine:cation symporter family protein [Eubacteriales bacterium]|nr:alanine:cation symporter family protein [Eubacteriales bacterium]
MKTQLAWDISETFSGLMMIPNLTGVIILSPIAAKCTKSYADRRIRNKKGIKPLLSPHRLLPNRKKRLHKGNAPSFYFLKYILILHFHRLPLLRRFHNSQYGQGRICRIPQSHRKLRSV